MNRIFAVTAPALLLLSCATPSPSVGANRLRALVVERDACRDAPCRHAVESALLELATRASEGAGTARQEHQRLGHLRVGGLAAWQAGEAGEQLAARINQAALSRCRTLDALAREGLPVGNPDDCAVLEALPALVAHAAAMREIQRLAGARPDPRNLYALETLAADYPSQTFLLLADLEPRLLAYRGLSDRIADWLIDSRRRTFCDYARVRIVAEAWPEHEQLTLRVAARLQRETDAAGTNCDGVPPMELPPPDLRGHAAHGFRAGPSGKGRTICAGPFNLRRLPTLEPLRKRALPLLRGFPVRSTT